MKPSLPLLAGADPDAIIAWVDGEAISAARFLAETQALAKRMPAQGEVVNFCNDRYLFALAFAAALCRGLSSLFPPNSRPETLSLLADAGLVRTVLVDQPDIDTGALPSLRITRPAWAELPSAPHARPLIPGDLVAACLLTSGSTGVPQPHAKQWRTLVHNIAAEAQRLADLLGLADLTGLTLVATVPPQHSYGFESSVLLALLGGATFDSGRPFYPADIVGALARVPRPRALVTTPFHLKTLIQSGVALPPVDLILSATAPLSPQLAAQAEQAMGAALIEIYGCTEAGQVATRRTTAGDTWETLGDLRVYGSADAADGVGDRAEVFMVKGGHVSEPTALADLLVIETDRRFRLLGRANDLIHVAGRRSSLAHLNFHLNRVDGVHDGCFWLPDEDGEVVGRTVAFVVAPTLTARQIIAALRHQIDPIFLPRRVVFVDALPREATGKLTAQTLRRFATDALARSGVASGARAASIGEPATVPRPSPREYRSTCQIGERHPAFDGHFPGQPVLPGVVLLSEVLAAALAEPAIAQRLGERPVFESAKFLSPVGPDSALDIVLCERAVAGGAAWSFDVRRGERVVARGVLRASPAVAAAPPVAETAS